MPRSHGKRKKRRTQEDEKEEEKVPRSMIVKRGKTSKEVQELVQALRKVMAPNTAMKLKEKKNSVKDLVQGGLALGVTHLVLVSEQQKVRLRIARTPSGPTTHFDISSFQLPRNVRGEQRRPYDTQFSFATPPLVVLAGFKDVKDPAEKLVRATFENMFPATDVATIQVAEIRRVVLVARQGPKNYELRHYAVRATAAGVSKPIQKIIQAQKHPDLSNLSHVADYVHQLYPPSDSEDEDPDHAVQLPGKFTGRGNVRPFTFSF